MAISAATVSTDYKGMQTDVHGTSDFPVACFDEDMDRDICVWHWHDSFEIILVTGGRVCVRIGPDSVTLGPDEGIFINVRQLHICEKGEALARTVRTSGSGQAAGTGRPASNCLTTGVNCLVPGTRQFGGEVRQFVDDRSTLHSLVFLPSAASDADTLIWQRYIRPVIAGNRMYVVFGGKMAGEGNINLDDQLMYHAREAWAAEAMEPDLYEIKVRYHLTSFLALIAQKMKIAQAAAPRTTAARDQRDATRMRHMLRFIEDHFMNQITLGDIAKSASVSEGECIRCFKRSIHTSPVQYMKHYRILRAKEYLLEPGASVNEVAERCGFQDPGYFIRCFSKLTGTTPGMYKK